MSRDGRSVRLHLGVVTHPRSRFNVDGAAGVLVESLGALLRNRGADVSTVVSDRNDYDPALWPLTRSELVQSGWHQSLLEYRWRRYLADGSTTVSDAALLAAMSARRMGEAAIGGLVPSSEARYGRTAARRLLNIDLSHLRVLDGAAETGADWVLVLEDDAWPDDPEAAAEGVLALIAAAGDTPMQFASLSTSLSHEQLGVAHLLRPAGELVLASGSRALLATARPVTNTVCATLYRASFSSRVASSIRAAGLVPVVPIDWRLNQVILDLWSNGDLDADSALWVEPGLFVQRSMHAVG